MGSLGVISGSPQVAVLGYHKIAPPPEEWWTWWYVPTDVFAQQLVHMREEGWEPISVSDLVRGLDDPESLPARSFLVTFDDAYASLTEGAATELERLGVPGVVFTPTAFVGGWNRFDDQVEPREDICDWDALRELQGRGVSVQSHGVSHRDFSTLVAAEQAREAEESKRVIEERIGEPVDLFAYPYGAVGDVELIERAGYRAAFGFGGGPFTVPAEARYALPRLAMGPDTDLAVELAA